MRETRYLWVGNLGENVREDKIFEYFRRYGKIDKVRFLSKRTGDSGLTAYVAFMDIRSAQKAKTAVNIIGDRELLTDYFDPVARAGNEESQRHESLQQSQSRAIRRYEGIKNSGPDERPGRESMPLPLPERSYPALETGSNNGNEKVRLKSDLVETKSRLQSSSKKKPDVKTPKKKTEDVKTKPKKGPQKWSNERGRSPTVKQRKSYTSSGSSPSRSAGSKRLGSSTEGRSSSSVSVGGGSVSDGHRSSSASSSSSTGSSNSSKTHRSNSESSESSYEVEEKPESRKLVPMCIRKLPIRPTITSLRDGIFHEFKKYGKVKSVLVRGDGADRHALVLFRTAAEANKAVAHARTKLLFGAAIEASIYEGEVTGQELEECGGIIDEFHPRASRTLFVGNLDKTVGYSDIQNIFVRFGEIVAIEIKKQHNIPQYAFLQYTDIMSVVRAITKMDGEKLGRNTLKLGFGKTVISSCLWVDGVTDSFTENYLSRCFQRYGPVKHVVIDRSRGQALVFYAQYDFAQSAMQKLRARKLNGSRLKMDYASNELVEIFLKHMKNSGQSFQGLDSIRQLLQPPSSPVSNPMPSSSTGYTRSSIPQENRSTYYEERHQSNYSDEQYADGNYRRGWRGRSRERHPYPVEQTSYNRPKRSYEDSYSRPDYHRESTWEHESYADGRGRLSQHDQDYRQRDYDFRRDHRGYVRKQSSRGSVPYDDSVRYRGSRDRYRDERDSESVRDRDQTGDRYYSRSVHLSPSHPRYHPRRSRSVSPHPRDHDRYAVERGAGDAPYRRRESGSPDVRYDSIHRLNSIDSKSSSHSESRYPARSGDVDMREYMDDDKLSVSSRQSDERIVEFTERARKLHVRKRVTADLAAQEGSLSPHLHYKYRGAGDSARNKNSPDNYAETPWQSDSPGYSDSRSVGGTPTRDENEDLIGEVIIKKSGSRVTDKSSSLEKMKPHQKGSSGDDKLCDKDYRKDFTGSSASIKSDTSSKSARSKSRSTSLIKRVHSPPEIRKENVAYEKDFDYRKPPTTGTSKPDAHDSRQKRSKASRSDEQTHGTDTGSDYDQQASPSERRMSSGGPSLLKREYSPKLKDNEDSSSKRTRNADLPSSKEKYKENKRKMDTTVERDESSRQSQKRRHSQDADASAARVKRERKSISEHHKHKSSHDHSSQKHEAPMSIASQMFLQDEEDSGAESPVITQEADPVEIEKQPSHMDESFTAEKPESPSSNEISAATLSAAKSLLPKAFSKPPKQIPVVKENTQENQKKEGNLTELEKEKKRLQKLLSKLDSEKQLNPKDAEEVADVVLQELTQKARSKLNIVTEPKPDCTVKEEGNLQKEKTEIVEDIVDETVLEIDKDEDIDPLESDDVTFEEEVVVDTIEEVTEDEIIETEVEEITVKDDEETEDPNLKVEEVQEVVIAPQPTEVVIEPTEAKKIDNSLGYRKQMEAQRKEMEKMEKKKDSQRKKILKKQEKEKKKQIERVSAMRGPGQSVVSSVDDGVDDETSSKEVAEDVEDIGIDDISKLETKEPVSQVSNRGNDDENNSPAKNGDDPTDVGLTEVVAVDHVEGKQLDLIAVNDASEDVEIVSKESSNEELWPPDRGKDAVPSSENALLKHKPKDKDENVSINSLQCSGKISVKNVTPTTPNSAGPNTPVPIAKESSPKISVQGLTPSSSAASSQSQRTQAVTTNRTPVFTTPSPASSSSTSSSKSQRHKQMKMAPHQRHAHSSRMGQSRADHSSRSHGHHGSSADHRRLSSHSHRSKMHVSSSSGQNHHKSDGHKKPAPQMSRRSLATITVGLDASPSKPLSRSELERLRHELESVRHQLSAESVSPSSLSPCSDDEIGCKSRSPAQLLSPISPLLKSPGNVMAQNKRGDGHFTAILPNSSSATSSLTDRLKLLGKVKKRTSSVIPDVKTDPSPAPEHMTNDQTESMNSRIYRSSIIDQDSERLSHISQGLTDNNLNNLHQTVTPLAQNVPLFSGSKFLQSADCPPVNSGSPAIPSMGPVENSVTPNVIMSNERTGVGGETCNQSPISSNSGPKNVISLSSSNLPVTAERLSDVFGKKSNVEMVEPGRLVTPKEEVCSEGVDSFNSTEPCENIAYDKSNEMNIAEGESPREIVPLNTIVCPSMEPTAEMNSQLAEANVPENTGAVAEPTPHDENEVVAHQLQPLNEDSITNMNLVPELDLEPGSCMEISTEDVVDAIAGEDSLMMDEDFPSKAEDEKEVSCAVGTSENSASEVTTRDKSNEIDRSAPDESETVSVDASKKPEKLEEDIHTKKKAKVDSVMKGSEDGKSKKEKSKIEKKKSSKSESSKIKVSSKHKLSKDGKKEKVVKKDTHKKVKTEAIKTKSSDVKPKLPGDDNPVKTLPKPSFSTNEKQPSASNEREVSKEDLRKTNLSENLPKRKEGANDRDENGAEQDNNKKIVQKKSMQLEEKTKKSQQLEEKVEKKTKVKSEKRENVEVWSSSSKDKSDCDQKSAKLPESKIEPSAKSGKSESMPKDGTTHASKKKKKKKHAFDKREKHLDQKQVKQLHEGKSGAECSHPDKTKKKLDGNEKSKKTVVEKLRVPEGSSEKSKSNENIIDGMGKSNKEHAKSSVTSSLEKASSGSSKKEKSTKKIKAHSDLKLSHSAPPSTLKNSSDGFEGRKKLKKTHPSKKEEKTAMKKSPQPLIFSDSSDDTDNDGYSRRVSKAAQRPIVEESEKMGVEDHNDEKKWSDLDDDAEPEKRHWSMSSSSSVLDSSSLGVGQSAMLTTETIKNETILPDEYKRGAYSGSSDEDFGKISRNRPLFSDGRSSTLPKNQKNKSLENKMKSAESKTSQKPVFGSSSDSDSSENRLVMSLTNSESSDEVSKPKKSVFFKRSAMAFSDEEVSDHDAEPQRRIPKPQLKALPAKAEHRTKTPHGEKTKVQKTAVGNVVPGYDRKIQSKKIEKSSKKSEAKLAKKLAKAHKKEKRKAEISSDNDSDVAEGTKPSNKMKSKHPSKMRKLDVKHEQSPTKLSGKLDRKSSKASPKIEDRKEKPHSKSKKHKDSSKTRTVKIDGGKPPEQEFEKSGIAVEKSDISGFAKKKEKSSTKSSSVKSEYPNKESRQTPDRELVKHSKKGPKHQKKSELSSARFDTTKSDGEIAEKNVVSKDGRSKKDHTGSDKSHKQEREHVKKEKSTASAKEEGTSKIDSSKTDERKIEHEDVSKKEEKTEDIGYSLFGSESDDDDDNFMIDEDRDDTVNAVEIPTKIIETETYDAAKLAENDTSKSVNQVGKDGEDNFMSSTTSDDSDKEQKEAVQSAITMLNQDHDMHNVKPDDELQTSQHEECRDEISKVVERLFDKPPPRPRSLSPLKKITVAESSRNRKSSHDLCDVKREKFSSLNPPHTAYPVSQRHLTYSSKDRWERMDKMKSISHEREEEAVRSIMGILDESSDADSYFSDVNAEKASSHHSASENVVPDVERSHQKSKDSDGGVQACADSLSEEVDKEGESCHENEDGDDELTKMRSTAEENELAAAVSAIEGLFGDNDDSFIPDNSHQLNTQQTTEEVSRKEPREGSDDKLRRAEKRDKGVLNREKSIRVKSPYSVSASVQKSGDGYQYSKQEIKKGDLHVGASGQLLSSNRSATSDLELPSIRADHRFPNQNFAQQQSSSYKKDTPDAPSMKQSEAAGAVSTVESAVKHKSTAKPTQMQTTPVIQARTKENVSDEGDKMQQQRNSPEPPVKHDSMEGSVIRTGQAASAADDSATSFTGLPFVSTVQAPVQAPASQRKPSVTSASSLPFVAVSTAIVTQASVSLPVSTTAEQPVSESQKSVDQRPVETPNIDTRDVASDHRRSSFASSSSSSLGGYVSKTISKPELSKQSSVPTSTHISTTPPQLHHPRLSVPAQPTVSLKSTISTTVVHSTDPGSRVVYSHAHTPPFVGFQEQMMPIRNPVLPQPPFGLTQNRFASSQVPTAAIMPFQHPLASQQQPDAMQRAIPSPYLLQHSATTHNTPTQTDVTTQARIRENQQPMHNQPVVEKSDAQRSAPSNQNVNAPLVSSLPGMPQLPPHYLHPAQAGMQQKPVYPPHLYYPGTTVSPFPSISPYMNPFLGMRPAVPPIPIVRTVTDEASRQPQKPLQTPPPRAMPPQGYPPRREQPAHIPMNRPNYAMKPQVAVHPTFPAQHAPPDSRHPGPTQMHQSQYVKHEANQYQPQRTEHGERFVRAESEQSQMEMVEQHFALSGIAPSQPAVHPHQSQTVAQDNKGYPPTQEAQTPTTMQHQSASGHGNNVYPQVVPRHVLGMPHGLLPHGEKYVAPIPGVMPWPYSGGNFRPPSIPSQQSQLQQPPRLHTHHPPDTYQGHAMTNPNPATEAPDQVMDLFQRYPVIWQGLLALKNDSAAVQTHFICGDRNLAQACLPQPDSHVETDKERNLAVLRIVQRMRLEPQQLEGIDNRIMENSDYCLLLALPCGRDKTDVNHQQCALKRSFIDYLKQKQAAGIVNVQHQVMQSNLQYVLHVFPPCEFTTKHLQCHARDLLSNINDIQHIMIVIAAV